MSNNKRPFEARGLTIDYRRLGTIHIDHLVPAIWEDIQMLKDEYNIRYVKNPRLRLLVTNEYGEELKIRRPGGGSLHYTSTHYYSPACKDYDP